MVHPVGFEPTHLAAPEPESGVYANFTTGAFGCIVYHIPRTPRKGVFEKKFRVPFCYHACNVQCSSSTDSVTSSEASFPPSAFSTVKSIFMPISFDTAQEAHGRNSLP